MKSQTSQVARSCRIREEKVEWMLSNIYNKKIEKYKRCYTMYCNQGRSVKRFLLIPSFDI